MLGPEGLGEPKLIGREEEFEKLDRFLQLAFGGQNLGLPQVSDQ